MCVTTEVQLVTIYHESVMIDFAGRFMLARLWVG